MKVHHITKDQARKLVMGNYHRVNENSLRLARKGNEVLLSGGSKLYYRNGVGYYIGTYAYDGSDFDRAFWGSK
jgi:hypothetical protein